MKEESKLLLNLKKYTRRTEKRIALWIFIVIIVNVAFFLPKRSKYFKTREGTKQKKKTIFENFEVLNVKILFK